MKKEFLLITVTLLSVFESVAQNRFRPLESWPYIYEDFNPGSIFMSKGNVIQYNQLNINLIDGKVHYIEDGTVMQADINNVNLVRIRHDVYLNHGGYMYKVQAETKHGAVLLKKEADIEEMSKADIGYGRSATASTSSLRVFALDGGNLINKSLEDINKNRYSGKELILRERYYLIIDGKLVRASKNEVLSWSGTNKNLTKKYIKDNKVKWKNEYDLSLLVEFLYEITQSDK